MDRERPLADWMRIGATRAGRVIAMLCLMAAFAESGLADTGSDGESVVEASVAEVRRGLPLDTVAPAFYFLLDTEEKLYSEAHLTAFRFSDRVQGRLVIRHWSFGLDWDLGFGIWSFRRETRVIGLAEPP